MSLQARDVTWSADGTTIIDGIDVDLADGELVGLLGPNGSGKTTLLRALAGLTDLERGSVHLDGDDLATLRRREIGRRTALLEQQADTDLDLLVLDVVLLGRIPHHSPLQGDTHGDLTLAMEALHSVGLARMADRPWQTLSGGERQRAQLARAIAQQPTLLLLDEPTNHLDLGHQLQLLTFVREARITTLAALHDINLAAMFCDGLVVLHHGRVVGRGPVAEVLTSQLLAEVFEVRADVEIHPGTGRPHLVVHPQLLAHHHARIS